MAQVKVTLAAGVGTATQERTIQSEDEMVCIEIGNNCFAQKRAGDLVAGDKLCAFAPPYPPGRGATVDSVEVL